MRSLTKQKEAPEDPMEVADNTEYGGELPDIEIPEVAGDMSSGDGIAEWSTAGRINHIVFIIFHGREAGICVIPFYFYPGEG